MADRKRFFPKIYFVDKLPEFLEIRLARQERTSLFLEKKTVLGVTLLGCYDSLTQGIYVYNGPRSSRCCGQFTTLIHELCHWVIFTVFGNGSKLHKILDGKK